MNPKRQVVEQAIADLREHQQALKIMSKQYTPSVYDPEVENLMAELYDERVNIANRLFVVTQSCGIQLPSPNSRYYDPNPSPVFNVEDFQDFRRNKPLSYPVIVGNLTKYLDHIDYTILAIDRFIEQLERKLKRRKDLQENIVMKLTEAKLKQMILDEIKSNLSPQETAELEADIHNLEQMLERMSILQHAGFESYKQYSTPEVLAARREIRAEQSVLQAKIFDLLNKYNVPFSANPKRTINTLKKKFRRKNL